MKLFEEMEKRGHEELIFNYFKDVDLQMIISMHDSTLGRTIGSLRMNNRYHSDMEAIIESLRLSEVMTYQAATADVDSGGANTLLIGNPKKDKTEAYFRAVGRFVESLKGKMIIAPDLGTDAQDFKYIQRETNHTIFGSDVEDKTRPAAQITAHGLYWGIKACAKKVFGVSDLAGRSFAVQGLGDVGKNIVDYLKKEKTIIYVSDLIYDNIKLVEDKYPDIEVLLPDEILNVETDFLVPCAVGSIIDENNVDKLKCKVIAGSAYNIFTNDDLLDTVSQKGILYAPAFIIAAGDLFLLDRNLKLRSMEKCLEETKIIYNILSDILTRADDLGIIPDKLAREEAMKRYKEIDRINNILC
ncbi:MAG TPA: Glu/Leu/Phe/Val dehydrogenase dimerization domain-containing protein [Candidatus Deferrimicrobium sp.]|nr:Glu/Leu/Phe/Val dehydrogenase dimerization domain-containing protein [Candidatus Deferrimicrobium sp.]